jgi:hypothetical protein
MGFMATNPAVIAGLGAAVGAYGAYRLIKRLF